MRKLTRNAVQDVLTRELKLKDPVFRFETAGDRLIGSVISDTFKGKRDSRRQEMIWSVLEGAFGADAVKRVGMLLAYTHDEWNLDSMVVGSAVKH